MHLVLASVFGLLAMSSQTVHKTEQISTKQEQIRIVPVDRTPELDTIQLKVAIPSEGEILENPAWVQFRLDGYALGGDSSQFDRASELVETDMGQTVHVVIDNEPYFPINGPAVDPFNEDGDYYDMSYKFEIPYALTNGMHVIRLFPARSFGESLKGDHTFHATVFYIGTQKNNLNVDLSKPYLTYNEPSNQMRLIEEKPVLLDFFLTHAELSPDGYKVRVTIDGTMSRVLTSWKPYYIYGLKRGKHTLRLELLDKYDKSVSGLFNQVERTITIY